MKQIPLQMANGFSHKFKIVVTAFSQQGAK